MRSFPLLSCFLACVASTLSLFAQAGPFGRKNHEIGVTAAYSPLSGPVWGYDMNTRNTLVMVRYTTVIRHGRRVQLRYSPELVAFAALKETAPSETNPAAPVRNYAAGGNPVGFELSFRPGRRIQPFGNTNEGFVYYNQRVLSPEGSQFMFTLDFGVGTRIFATPRSAFALGYRYQHTSNANISVHNPGTDSNLFTVGFSHFF